MHMLFLFINLEALQIFNTLLIVTHSQQQVASACHKFVTMINHVCILIEHANLITVQCHIGCDYAKLSVKGSSA